MLSIYDDFKVGAIAVSIPITDEILSFTKVYTVNYSLEHIDVNFNFVQAHSFSKFYAKFHRHCALIIRTSGLKKDFFLELPHRCVNCDINS